MLVAEHRAVLQLADDPFESLIALQRDVLRVIVANAAEPAVGGGDRSTAESTRRRRISVAGHISIVAFRAHAGSEARSHRRASQRWKIDALQPSRGQAARADPRPAGHDPRPPF